MIDEHSNISLYKRVIESTVKNFNESKDMQKLATNMANISKALAELAKRDDFAEHPEKDTVFSYVGQVSKAITDMLTKKTIYNIVLS